MSALADRLRANAQILASRLGALCRNIMPCIPPPPTVQGLDVRVRDPHANNAPVVGARVQITDSGGNTQTKMTDASGDAVFFSLVVGNWDVEARKEWFIPEPAAQNGVALNQYGLPVINLALEELRYYLQVDADRDGDIDNQHEGLNAIAPWQWGAGNRGAIILCNNDHDDGLAVGARNPDNEDNVVNQNNDGTHEIAPLRIWREGPNTAPPAATNWTATLEILNNNEDKIRIFAGTAQGSAQLLGAAHGAVAASAQHVINLRAAGPASYPTTILGMEAVTYPRHGFNGLIRIRLTVSKNRQMGAGQISYYTAAEVRVAPWMMPNHRDDAQRVYVTDLGPDVVVLANNIRWYGNQVFRNDLGVHLNAAGIGAANYVRYAPAAVPARDRDRWMQDCMEIGYSVLPKHIGAVRRHRIEAVMQAYRYDSLFDLKEYPRSLLDQDFGFHFPAAASAAFRYNQAIAGAPGASPARNAADNGAFWELIRQGEDGNLVPLLTVAQANAIRANPGLAPAAIDNAAGDVADAVEAALVAAGSVPAARNNMIADARNALLARGAPFNTAAFANVVDAVAREAAERAAERASLKNTFNSNGNLECTPPCRATAAAAAVVGVAAGPKDYPWGRIYYGRGRPGQRFDQATRRFLRAQQIQLPIVLDTNWLEVGHVDEMMTFIPAPGPAFRQWRLLLASPQRAFTILDGLPGITPILVGRQMRFGGVPTACNTTAGVLRNGAANTPIPNPAGGQMTGAQVRNFNLNFVQPRLDAIANRLVNEIGLVLAEVIHVPVVFMPRHAMNVAVALTADMVNMLIVNNHCIVPSPFGPIDGGNDVFEDALRNDIQNANPALQVHFIDDWYTYHVNEGEVHCGTNTRRRPANLNAWLQSADAEWWRFDG